MDNKDIHKPKHLRIKMDILVWITQSLNQARKIYEPNNIVILNLESIFCSVCCEIYSKNFILPRYAQHKYQKVLEEWDYLLDRGIELDLPPIKKREIWI